MDLTGLHSSICNKSDLSKQARVYHMGCGGVLRSAVMHVYFGFQELKGNLPEQQLLCSTVSLAVVSVEKGAAVMGLCQAVHLSVQNPRPASPKHYYYFCCNTTIAGTYNLSQLKTDKYVRTKVTIWRKHNSETLLIFLISNKLLSFYQKCVFKSASTTADFELWLLPDLLLYLICFRFESELFHCWVLALKTSG